MFGAPGGTAKSNLTVLTVGTTDNHQPIYPTGVTPKDDAAGTQVLGAVIFAPGESVAVWYHTPDNRDVAVGTYTADTEGRLGVEFATTGLAPGNHFFVAYGIRTRFTAVGPFTVR